MRQRRATKTKPQNIKPMSIELEEGRAEWVKAWRPKIGGWALYLVVHGRAYYTLLEWGSMTFNQATPKRFSEMSPRPMKISKTWKELKENLISRAETHNRVGHSMPLKKISNFVKRVKEIHERD